MWRGGACAEAEAGYEDRMTRTRWMILHAPSFGWDELLHVLHW